MKKTLINLCKSNIVKGALVIGGVFVSSYGLTSCSNDDLLKPGDLSSNDIEMSAMKVTNDPGYLSRYVTNYRTGRSRAVEGDIVLASAPAAPTAEELAAATPLVLSITDKNGVQHDNVLAIAPGYQLGTDAAYIIDQPYDASKTYVSALIGLGNVEAYSEQVAWWPEAEYVDHPANVLNTKYGYGNGAQLNGAQWAEIVKNGDAEEALKAVSWMNFNEIEAGNKVFNTKANITLYINSDFNATINASEGKANVYVLNGDVTLDFPLDQIQANTNLYVYENFNLRDGIQTLTNNGNVYFGPDADFNHPDVDLVMNGGVFACAQDIHVKNYRNNTLGTSVQAKCLIAEEKVDLKNVGEVVIKDYITAGEEINFEGTSRVHMAQGSLVKAPVIRITGQYGSDVNQIISHGADKYTVVACDELYFGFRGNDDADPDHDGDLSQALLGYIYLAADNLYAVGNEVIATTPDRLILDADVKYGENDEITVPEILEDPDGCRGSYGKAPNRPGTTDPDPEDPEDPKPTIEVIAKVEMDHQHPISATCIDINGNQAFVSWHERGDNMKGCIEILNIDLATETVEFQAWMETDEWIKGAELNDNVYDFNHLVYDQRTNSILTVGDHPKKGGFVGQIKVTDAFATGSAVGANIDCIIPRQIPLAASGNSILRYGDDLYIAGAGGYTIFPFADGANFAKPVDADKNSDYTRLTDCTNLETGGSAKHLALNGSTIATIEYTKREGDERPAKISLWNADSWIKGSATTTWDVPAFGPTYGKDVIAIDDQYVYSCQGNKGVAVYDLAGNEVARFHVNDYLTKDNGFTDDDRNKMRNSAANGLCVYGNYVFVANGGAGVWVLDKTDFKPVAHFTDQEKYFSLEKGSEIGASANYVRVTGDGYVYVAYGLAGVMVLKFNEAN